MSLEGPSQEVKATTSDRKVYRRSFLLQFKAYQLSKDDLQKLYPLIPKEIDPGESVTTAKLG